MCTEGGITLDESMMMGQIPMDHTGFLFFIPNDDLETSRQVPYQVQVNGVTRTYKMIYEISSSEEPHQNGVPGLIVTSVDDQYSLCGQLQYRFINDDYDAAQVTDSEGLQVEAN